MTFTALIPPLPPQFDFNSMLRVNNYAHTGRPSHGTVVDVDGTVVSGRDDLGAGAVVLHTPHLKATREKGSDSNCWFILHGYNCYRRLQQ